MMPALPALTTGLALWALPKGVAALRPEEGLSIQVAAVAAAEMAAEAAERAAAVAAAERLASEKRQAAAVAAARQAAHAAREAATIAALAAGGGRPRASYAQLPIAAAAGGQAVAVTAQGVLRGEERPRGRQTARRGPPRRGSPDYGVDVVPSEALHPAAAEHAPSGRWALAELSRAFAALRRQREDPPPGDAQQQSPWRAAVHGICLFYGILYGTAAALYLSMRGVEATLHADAMRNAFTQALKWIAQWYVWYPRASPLVATASLFFVGDILGQATAGYWADLQGYGFWDWRSGLAVAATSCVLQGAVILYAYDRLDDKFGNAPDLASLARRTAALQLAFAVAWLPVCILVFGTVAGLLYRTSVEATSHCGAAAVVGLPGNLYASVAFSTRHWGSTFAMSVAFWPPSHMVNYLLVQRWVPNFRGTWDGVVVVIWNLFVLCTGTGVPAVGPLLSGRAPIDLLDWPAPVDCGQWSAGAVCAKIGDFLRYVALKLWEYYRKFCRGTLGVMGWTWKSTTSLVGWLWCNIGLFLSATWWGLRFLLLWLVTGARLVLWLPIMVVWQAVRTICAIWDGCKWILCMWWVPEFFPYESCPYCFLFPGNGSWPLEILSELPHSPPQCVLPGPAPSLL